LLTVTLMGAAYAQKPAVMVSDKDGWHKISETSVNFKTDRDEIVVMGADKFKALKFKVTQGAIDLQDLEVIYSEGDKEDIQVRTPIAEGGESRVIDLKGYERELKKVVFVYKTLKGSSSDKAHVELYGKK
jgi:hypothetical protein